MSLRTSRWSIYVALTVLALLCLLAVQLWHSETGSIPHPDSQAAPDLTVVKKSSAREKQANTPQPAINRVAGELPERVARMVTKIDRPVERQAPAVVSPSLQARTLPLPAPVLSKSRVPGGRPPGDGPVLRAGELPIRRAALEPPRHFQPSWPAAESLQQQIEPLMADPQTSVWAEQLIYELRRLQETPTLGGARVARQLEKLAVLVPAARALQHSIADRSLQADLARAAYALERRLDVWFAVNELAALPRSQFVSAIDNSEMAAVVQQVKYRLASDREGASWREFLLLDQVDAMTRADSDISPHAHRQLARRVLQRMHSDRLTDAQQRFLSQRPFDSYAEQLRRWAGDPIDYRQLLASVERFERHPGTTEAAALAAAAEQLQSSSPESARLGAQLNQHYRNANIRLAISEQMVNRLLPTPAPIREPVRQQLLGARVLGRSYALSELEAVLSPDPHRWNIRLRARGNVHSQTESRRGPAVFYNRGDARYQVTKALLVGPRGLQVRQAEAEADGDSRLLRMETSFDSLPIIGSLVRSYAFQQYEEQVPLARRAMNQLVANRAGRRVDQEVQDKLSETEAQFRRVLLQPLDTLELNPTTISMETSSTQRLITRIRLASDHQLGAHTPRPMAPGDSVLSVQVHQTALNNTIDQLQLAGKRTDLHSLFRELVTLFGRSDLEPPEDLPDDVVIELAEEEPIRVHFEDGQVRLMLRFNELETPTRRFRNFVVRAGYVPHYEGLHAELAREEYIGVSGPELGFRDRVPLRGIFSAVLAKERPLSLLRAEWVEREALQDLRVSQLLVEDGWIGVALSPTVEPRTAERN